MLLLFAVRNCPAQLLSGLPQAQVSECDYCGCSQGISPLETGSTGIRFEFGSLYLGAPYNGSLRQTTAIGKNESFITNKLTLFYRLDPTSPFTLAAAVPYVNRVSQDPGGNGAPIQTAKGNGLGDIAVTLRYNHLHHVDESTIAFSAGFGVKFPTGKDNILVGANYLDPDLQPGTGTTDLLFNIAGFWSLDRFGVAGNLTAGVITGPGAPESDGNHKYGNYINGDLTFRYRVIPADASESNLSVMFGIGAENRAHETEGGQMIIPSGGSIIYVAPGLKYIVSTQISADATFQIPVYQYLGWNPDTGDNQLGQNYRFVAGIQYRL
ncbi:MAG TPA: hypothetical protein VEW28_05395 [Candidatus Kapabacteria bacterium]|nr:hypothetical protein [Candidatus Kapabacteria bacterium]